MKKSFVNIVKMAAISGIALLAMSCGSTQLYSWYDYQEDELAKTYQKIIEKQKATRGVVPPGIYADYGWLLLQAGKNAEGKEMLAKEIELYPESKVFVGSILKRYAK